MKDMYSKKEVVELFNEFKSDWCNDYQMADIDKFLKEKGLIEEKKELPTINWDLRNLDAIMINGETYIKK